MKDYYKILGVSRQATTEEIKKSYRTLAFKFHPDRNSDPYAIGFIKELNEAYDVLGDEKKRSNYNFRLDHKTTYRKTAPSYSQRSRRPPQNRYRQRKKQVNFNFQLWAYRASFLSGFVLLYCFLLSLDFLLAEDYGKIHVRELDIENYISRRGRVTHTIYHIESDKVNFTMSTERAINKNDTILVSITPIFGIATNCTVAINDTIYPASVYSVYSPIFFLVLVAIGFAAGARLTKSAEQSLLYSIASIVIFLFILFIMNRS